MLCTGDMVKNVASLVVAAVILGEDVDVVYHMLPLLLHA